MEQNLTGRIQPEQAARARELDERAMAGQGTAEDALESLAIALHIVVLLSTRIRGGCCAGEIAGRRHERLATNACG